MRIGVDEVGRGCLAGDLVVCAFAARPDLTTDEALLLRETAMDSKAFKSRARREAAAAAIRPLGQFEFARATPDEIDRLNIRGATLDAMRRAALALRARTDQLAEILFDGRDIPDGVPVPVGAVIKGDASVLEISAASILAKTLRDAEMDELALRYPGYGFELHAGYGTPAHRKAIATLGLTGIHRSWARKFVI